jgi:hypothetical protein
MWYQVLESVVDSVVFVDDWAFSGGCCNEYVYATGLGLPTLNERLEYIDAAYGLHVMRHASLDLKAKGKHSPIRESAIARLVEMTGLTA